ncbi:BKACE family enzyme [Plastoroseomonas hellenica]|uniref:3-keto-5-aminohexanoate cleavage protein n=1 Tax=Plastoroseomonas hellenica TaxID=2687306 RepID=UPI002010E40F|nr:3-keto-5-aminohexanoate cleavage protein [Plastoroseomonas hellenica]
MRRMRDEVIITCAITGNLTTPDQTPHLPITPQQIADSALEAAEAGAAMVHLHVRDPATGRPSMELGLYREVVERIRAGNSEVIVNLTTGPGGRFVPGAEEPRLAGPGTTLTTPERRTAHVTALRPDVATLDLNTMNSGAEVVINTPGSVRRMAAAIRAAGSVPEIELFDSGDIALLADLLRDGTLVGPVLCSFVCGVKYGFQPLPETVLYARDLLPPDAQFTVIGIGRACFPMVAQSVLAGGHVRVGMEDAVYLDRGVLAPSNAALVEKARGIVESLGARAAAPARAREILGLAPARAAAATAA